MDIKQAHGNRLFCSLNLIEDSWSLLVVTWGLATEGLSREAGQGQAGMLSMAGNLACKEWEDGAVVSELIQPPSLWF